MNAHCKRVVVLGSTGSIGRQTLDVIRTHPDRFKVVGLACNKNIDLLMDQIEEFQVPAACLKDRSGVLVPWPTQCTRLPYPEGLEQLAVGRDTDLVVVATVGDAGFRPTEAALRAGNTVALASKELLVMGGQLFRDLADSSGAEILPIDSEHSALWQCLAGETLGDVRQLILTASGGPFRDATASSIRDATAEQALRNPTWVMGGKVTIDSATLLNKGLEIIEAHWLFGVPYKSISVVIHPESIVHSMVEFHDGSLKAQLGAPDMRMPIQYALGYPERLQGDYARLSFDEVSNLRFESPDYVRFPLLSAAMDAGLKGGTAPAVLCGADEAAVEIFLEGKIRMGHMVDLVREALSVVPSMALDSLDAALEAHHAGADQVRRSAAAST